MGMQWLKLMPCRMQHVAVQSIGMYSQCDVHTRASFVMIKMRSACTNTLNTANGPAVLTSAAVLLAQIASARDIILLVHAHHASATVAPTVHKQAHPRPQAPCLAAFVYVLDPSPQRQHRFIYLIVYVR